MLGFMQNRWCRTAGTIAVGTLVTISFAAFVAISGYFATNLNGVESRGVENSERITVVETQMDNVIKDLGRLNNIETKLDSLIELLMKK